MKKALVRIGRQEFHAEVADNALSRVKGLSGRAALAQDEGMLFVFSLACRYSFWMKGMRFPLDIIWVRGDRVVDISEDVHAPEPGSSIFKLRGLRPKAAVDKVLEVNAGLARKFGMRIGDRVEIVAAD